MTIEFLTQLIGAYNMHLLKIVTSFLLWYVMVWCVADALGLTCIRVSLTKEKDWDEK